MLLGELVEIGGDDLPRGALRPRRERHLVHLQQQTLLQAAGADSGWFQLVDDPQQPLELLRGGLDTHREGDVVGHRFEVAAQVAVLVDAADEVDGQPHVAIRKVAVAQLLDQILVQRTTAGEVDRALLVVFRIVVDTALVRGRVVLAQILLDGDFAGLLLAFGIPLVLLEHDVVLDLLLDALFELHGGQLQQLDHLNLLRRELLLQGEYLFLIDRHR